MLNALELDISGPVAVPLIASGGCALAQHFEEGYQPGALAVVTGTCFCQLVHNSMHCHSDIRDIGLLIQLEV